MQRTDLKRKIMMNKSENLYRGKERGLYDPSNIEVFFTKLGQEIYKGSKRNERF